MKFNLKGVSVQTWVRTIVLIIALVNQFFVVIGKTTKTIDIDEWYQYASYFITAITSVIGFWNNNSFTHYAQIADTFIEKRKDESK